MRSYPGFCELVPKQRELIDISSTLLTTEPVSVVARVGSSLDVLWQRRSIGSLPRLAIAATFFGVDRPCRNLGDQLSSVQMRIDDHNGNGATLDLGLYHLSEEPYDYDDVFANEFYDRFKQYQSLPPHSPIRLARGRHDALLESHILIHTLDNGGA